MRRALSLVVLLGACRAPTRAPASEPPPQPMISREEVLRVLGALEATFYTHWGAVENTPEFRTLGPAHVRALRDIADANGEFALVAYRVLRKLAPGEAFSDSAKAILYATALEREENFLRWGVLTERGLLPGVYGDEMMSLRSAAVPYLGRLLRNVRPARVRGDEAAERSNRHQADRVCDYAWVFAATILGRPFTYSDDPRERDPQIREFDLWLDRRR